MQQLYKRFVEWVTKWKTNNQADEFFKARLRLTFYYSITAIVILGGSSIILYNTILSNLTQSIMADGRINPFLSGIIIDRAQDILFNRFLTIDLMIIFFIIILGFFVTHKTLTPIKSNMQKQKRFIADASHELRTPISVVMSGIEVALNNKKLDFVLAKKTLENTLEEMIEFSKLSNTLLDISTSHRLTHVKHAPMEIAQLLQSISERYKNVAKAKNIIIETDIKNSTTVEGNDIEFTRVFYNILDNAVKYTPENGTIKIIGEKNLNKYVVTIKDSGEGISPETIDKIFEPFFRGELARHTTHGAGLGLALVKKIVEDHKGTISVASELNKGTSVSVSIPISSS